MKSLSLFTFILLFISKTVGQTVSDYPFEIAKSGRGDRSMILIPGFACSGEVWNETVSMFKEDYTSYILTMSGFAGTTPKANANFEIWKTGIVDFIKENNIDKPILVGHSMGGGIAMAIAADHPDLIVKTIIIDALPCLQALSNPGFKSEEKLDCSATVNRITSLPEEQFYQMQKMSIPQFVENKKMMDTILNWTIRSDRRTFAEMYCDFANTDLRDKIKNITCPTLVLLESNFKNFKPAIEEQYKNLRTANLQYANKGLHFIMYDDKEWYFDNLSNFLEND